MMKDKRRKSSETFIPAFDPFPSLPRAEEHKIMKLQRNI